MGGFAGGLYFGVSKGRRGVAGLPTKLAESGDKKEGFKSKTSAWWFVVLVLKVQAKGELGMLYLSPGDLRFVLASLAFIWLCMEPLTAGLRE